MSIQNAYNEWAEIYDHDVNRTRDLDRRVMAEALANRHFDSILELGSGTGKNTALLAEVGERVHALDFSAGMIKKARQKVSAGHVRFELADLTRRWPCEDAAYDLVVCNLVLEHIENLPFVFSEVGRVLKGGGQFRLHELHPFRQYEGKKARFESGAGVTEIAAFIHHISDFLHAASQSNLHLVTLDERWHPDDEADKPPRLIVFLFEKLQGSSE